MGEINTCSMQGGVVLGVFGILSLVVFRWSFVIPFFSTLFGVMMIATPILIKLQFRKITFRI